MSTEIATIEDNANDAVTVTSFYGGERRGQCLQLTQYNAHAGRYERVQVTKDQIREMMQVADEWL